MDKLTWVKELVLAEQQMERNRNGSTSRLALMLKKTSSTKR